MVKEDGLIKGLSTETKPTETDPIAAHGFPVKEGDIYLEWDTGSKFCFLSGEWVPSE